MRELVRKLRLPEIALLAVALLAFSASVARAQFGLVPGSFSTSDSTSQAGAHGDFSAAFALQTEALGNPIGQLEGLELALPRASAAIHRRSKGALRRASSSSACPSGSQVGVLEASLIICQGVSSPLAVAAAAGATTITLSSTAGFCASEGNNEITIGTGDTAETATIASVENATTLALAAPLERSHGAGEGEPVSHVATATPVPFPLFNLQPSPGHAATLGASLLVATTLIQVDVDSEGSYRLTASIDGVSTLLSLQAATLTLWGVPADPSHDSLRCNELGFGCGASGASPAPFMTNPTDCTAALQSSLSVSSWQGQQAEAGATLPSRPGANGST